MSALLNCSSARTNSLPPLSPTVGQKRPPPTLLPAFEPLSSSPGYPRPSKRQAFDVSSSIQNPYTRYLTPIPSSTTGVISSSPLSQSRPIESQYSRAVLTDRFPLSNVPTVTPSENGEVIKIGRSSKSSDFQLSASRLISRVHVEARYIAATTPHEPNSIEIKCKGWNGLKLHCSGQIWQLAKNDTFTSETEFAEIMIDVQDARILIAWPERDQSNFHGFQNEFWNDENTPSRKQKSFDASDDIIPSSPIRVDDKIESPISPTPRSRHALYHSLDKLNQIELATVKIYEDTSHSSTNLVSNGSFVSTNTFSSASCSLSSLESELSDIESENPDEENDPIVHSFGPFGSNITSRVTSLSTKSSPVSANVEPSFTKSARLINSDCIDTFTIVNHATNQLAYSLKSSLPLSDLFLKLPSHFKENYAARLDASESKGLTKTNLQFILNSSQCIGEIRREGKDAAGKPLESEYYYILEEDYDDSRRAAVQGLLKPRLRNCRKKHKQYYWRKPKTP